MKAQNHKTGYLKNVNLKVNVFILLLALLGINSFGQSQWVNLLLSDGEKEFAPDFLSYLPNGHIYAATESGVFYYTKDNYKSIQTIRANIGAGERIYYFKMISIYRGVIVSRNLKNEVNIYTTYNGTYEWTKQAILPTPNKTIDDFQFPVAYDPLLFQFKKNKLYVSWGDVIFWGDILKNNWKTVRFNKDRPRNTSDFEVINDTLWSLTFGGDKHFTKNQGKYWDEGHIVLEPGRALDIFYSSLSDQIQYFRNTDNTFWEYNSNKNEWIQLSTPSQGSFNLKDMRQLSDTVLIVMYWHWVSNSYKNAVFNRQTNQWKVLDTLSSFFPPPPQGVISNWEHNGASFVRLYLGRIIITKDYGISWDTIHTTSKAKFNGIRQLIFYDSLALAEEQRHLLYSTDSGHSWNAYRLEDICDQLQLQFPCFYNLSYDPNGTPFIISKEVYKIQVKANELSLIQIPINHQNINIKQVSDMGVNDFFVLGSKNDSSYLYRKLPNGDLQELFSINYRVNEGLIIQNDHYVCFSINSKMFFFKKQTGQIVEINNNFLNSIHSLYFSSERKIIIINHEGMMFYDCQTLTYLNNYNFDKSKSYGFNSVAYNNKDELLLGHLYLQHHDFINIENIDQITIDSTILCDDIIRETKYHNGHYWYSGNYGIYKRVTIEENNHDLPCIEHINLFPNPTTNLLNMSFTVNKQTTLSFEIYNLIGQKVGSFEQNKYSKGIYENQLSIDFLSNGVYIIKLTSSCSSVTFKIIKH